MQWHNDMENEIIELKCEFGACRVSLVGAQVTSWVPAGGEERFYMSANTPWGKEVHGGIPICWPWYEAGPDKGQPIHGIARYVRWTSEERTVSGIRLALESSDETRRIWPYDFRLVYEVVLRESRLDCKLSALNTGSVPITANDAFHPYFAVRDVEKCHVDDEPDFITRPRHLSRYAAGAVGSRVLSGEGALGPLRISAKGHSGWDFWNPGEDQTPILKTVAPDDWRRFVCVEPDTRENYVLAPGETRTMEMALEVQ